MFGCAGAAFRADTNPAARATDAPFEDIAHAQLSADLLCVHRLVPIGECGVARDDEHVRNPRQIGRQILGDAVGEVALFRVVAQIGEGQHDY